MFGDSPPGERNCGPQLAAVFSLEPQRKPPLPMLKYARRERPLVQFFLSLSFLSIALVSCGGIALADNWPGWRGPRGDGSSAETNVPVRWGSTENVAWKTEIPGEGHASPIVSGERLFLVSALTETEERVLICLDRRTGNVVWRRSVVRAPLEQKHPFNSFASSTPATDGRRIYVTFLDRNEMLAAAYDFDGRQQWLVRPGPFSSKHGFCSAPVLFKDKVILNGDHDGDSYLVALDRETGKTLWKVPRENRTRSYSTPIIREIGGRTQMILSGNLCVASYDPEDGRRHWIVDGPTEQFVASVVYSHGLVLMTAGFPDRHIMAIKPDGQGNVTRTQIAWRTTAGAAYVPSPIAEGEYFVVVSDSGVASCFDVATGKRFWQERIGRGYSASAVSAGGLVYFLSDDGIMTVIRPGATMEIVARNKLGERCFASPAISEGQIFIRGEKHLYSIGEGARAERR